MHRVKCIQQFIEVLFSKALTFFSSCFSAEGDRYKAQSNALSAWFIGPRAENHQVFNELINNMITQHQRHRRKYWPTDPEYITKHQMMTTEYKQEKKELKERLKELNDDLQQSTPVFSPRFQVSGQMFGRHFK